MIMGMVNPQKFRQLRESKGMTTRSLAKEASVSTETINAIEHGRRQPTVRTLAKVAKALEVEVRDFF
jgi:putative transcriptional regulator